MSSGCGTSADSGSRSTSSSESSNRIDLTPELVRAGLLLKSSEPDAGIDQLISLLPMSEAKGDLHERIALSLLRTGRAQRALPYADSAILLGGSTIDRHKIRGIILNLLWNDSGALADFDRVLEYDPKDVQTLQMSARILERVDPIESVERYHRILRITGDDPFTLRLLINLLISEEMFEDVPHVVERLMAVDDEITPAWLPIVLLDAGRTSEAIESLERLLLLPGGSELHAALRNILAALAEEPPNSPGTRRVERFSRLLVNTIDSLSVDRMFPGDLISSGAVEAFSIGDVDVGSRLAARTLERTGTNRAQRYRLGNLALGIGMVDLGIRLLDVKPEGPEERELRCRVFVNHAGKFLREGGLDSALLFFTEAVRSDSLATDGWIGIGRVHYLLGEIGPSVGAFEHAVGIDPYDPDLLEHYGLILAFEGIHARRGYELVGELVLEDDARPGPAMMEAEALLAFRTGRIDVAQKILRSASQDHRLSPIGLKLMGDIHEHLGNRSMAVDFWRRGLQEIDEGDPSDWSLPLPEAMEWAERLRIELAEKLETDDGDRK